MTGQEQNRPAGEGLPEDAGGSAGEFAGNAPGFGETPGAGKTAGSAGMSGLDRAAGFAGEAGAAGFGGTEGFAGTPGTAGAAESAGGFAEGTGAGGAGGAGAPPKPGLPPKAAEPGLAPGLPGAGPPDGADGLPGGAAALPEWAGLFGLPGAENAAGAPGADAAGGAGPLPEMSGLPGASAAAAQRALEAQLSGMGLDPAALFGALLQSPLLSETAALAEEALAARRERRQAEAQRAIAALAPELRTTEQLTAAPEYPAMRRLQQRGMDPVDAFKLAFFDRLTRRQAEAGRQGAINAARARQHLAAPGGQPAAPDELTEAEIREYRKYNPRWSIAQIRRFHREYLAENGG